MAAIGANGALDQAAAVPQRGGPRSGQESAFLCCARGVVLVGKAARSARVHAQKRGAGVALMTAGREPPAASSRRDASSWSAGARLTRGRSCDPSRKKADEDDDDGSCEDASVSVRVSASASASGG